MRKTVKKFAALIFGYFASRQSDKKQVKEKPFKPLNN